MEIRYNNRAVVALAVGIFVVNALLPQAAFAAVQTPPGSNPVQCVTPPATGWCVPATAGSGVSGTFCSSTPAPPLPANRVVTSAEALGTTIGSILAFPFVVAQCVLGECP